jgi:hypothetical protein
MGVSVGQARLVGCWHMMELLMLHGLNKHDTPLEATVGNTALVVLHPWTCKRSRAWEHCAVLCVPAGSA